MIVVGIAAIGFAYPMLALGLLSIAPGALVALIEDRCRRPS
jgi:hypothetical protein